MLTRLPRCFPPLWSVGLCPSMVSCSIAVAPSGRNHMQYIRIHNRTDCFDNVNNNKKKLWKIRWHSISISTFYFFSEERQKRGSFSLQSCFHFHLCCWGISSYSICGPGNPLDECKVARGIVDISLWEADSAWRQVVLPWQLGKRWRWEVADALGALWSGQDVLSVGITEVHWCHV